MNTPKDDLPPRRPYESNIGLWVLAALGAFILLGALSWGPSDTIDEAKQAAQPQVENNVDAPATAGESSGEAGKAP